MSAIPPALKSRRRLKLPEPRLSEEEDQIQRRYESQFLERVPFPELIPQPKKCANDWEDDD